MALSSSSSASSSLLEYLRDTKAAFHHETTTSTTLHICIGNPAGDADSLISAIVYAYLQHTTPILSISRNDLLTQRPETMALLKLAQIIITDDETTIQDLFIDKDDLQDKLSTTTTSSSSSSSSLNLKITLVDHNAQVVPSTGYAGSKVVEILDHHDDLGQHMDAPIRNIAFDQKNGQATVASTCTLVAEAALQQLQQQQHQQTDNPSSTPKLDPSLSILLLGTILLDSVNMSPQAGKGTPRDAQAIHQLLASTNWNDATTPDPTQLFDTLQQAKFDVHFWNNLSVTDALRLDYKQFDINSAIMTETTSPLQLGLATILVPWKDFQQKENLVSSLERYAHDHSLDIMGCMMTSSLPEDGSLQRELLLCSRDDATRLNRLVQQLLDYENNFLQLKEEAITMSSGDSDVPLSMRFFVQGNAKASRKQVAPILMKLLAKEQDSTSNL